MEGPALVVPWGKHRRITYNITGNFNHFSEISGETLIALDKGKGGLILRGTYHFLPSKGL